MLSREGGIEIPRDRAEAELFGEVIPLFNALRELVGGQSEAFECRFQLTLGKKSDELLSAG